MPTPYESAAPAPLPRLVRPAEGRILGGVCVGIAEHLGVPVMPVRVVMVLLGLSGAGVIGYLLLWGLTPPAAAEAPESSPLPAEADPPGEASRLLVGGGVILLIGLAWILQGAGLDIRFGLLVPVGVIGLGALLGLSYADAPRRDQWLGGRGQGWRSAIRLGLGALLMAAGGVALVARGSSLSQTWDIAVATLVVLLGTAVLVAPWAYRLWSELRTEQAARARADERADIAAHLHDSVLQTLTLIQKQADDPVRVATLARLQERELRTWLYGGGGDAATSLAGALAEVIDDVEGSHGIPVDLVMTGDRSMDDGSQALVRALREALTNAAVHGAAPVSVYVEAGPSGVEAFVRDHGPGIDLDAIPEDRLGVRESIMGRMTRHGGTARVRRLEPGTEWTLTLPAPAEQGATV